MMRNVRRILAALIVMAALSICAFAQNNGSIAGTVKDSNGGVIPEATVEVVDQARAARQSVNTDVEGNFMFPELSPGTYTITVQAKGFKKSETRNVVLPVASRISVGDITVEVGSLTDTITVEANAVQIQADTNEVSQTITDAQVADLATNGRNVLQLAALVPGAASTMPDFDSPMAQNQSHSISYGGQRPDHNNWIVNGGEAYDRGSGGILIVSPSQDSLQEFKIMTSNFAADLGQSSGGMVTMVTKSGAKQFHGGAWEYVRNNAFDANTFFANLNGNKKPELRYNTFGFNLGGPVPKIGHQQKTFFFYNMEWRRLVQ